MNVHVVRPGHGAMEALLWRQFVPSQAVLIYLEGGVFHAHWKRHSQSGGHSWKLRKLLQRACRGQWARIDGRLDRNLTAENRLSLRFSSNNYNRLVDDSRDLGSLRPTKSGQRKQVLGLCTC